MSNASEDFDNLALDALIRLVTQGRNNPNWKRELEEFDFAFRRASQGFRTAVSLSLDSYKSLLPDDE